MKASNYVGHRVSYTPDDVMFSIKGLCVGYADFQKCLLLRSPDSPDFDLLVLHDGENDPEYVSGAYTFRIID